MDFKDFIRRFFGIEKELGELEREESEILERLYHLSHPKKKYSLIFTTIINKKQIKILSIMDLNTQEFVDSILALEDTDTKSPIDATFANIVLTSSDPSIFTCDTDVNADGTLDITGVSEGTATLTVTADATYIDGNTKQSVTANKSATIDVTVHAPLPGAENTDMVVTFSAPTPVK